MSQETILSNVEIHINAKDVDKIIEVLINPDEDIPTSDTLEKIYKQCVDKKIFLFAEIIKKLNDILKTCDEKSDWKQIERLYLIVDATKHSGQKAIDDVAKKAVLYAPVLFEKLYKE